MTHGFIKIEGVVIAQAWGLALYKCTVGPEFQNAGVTSYVLAAHRDFDLTVVTKAVWLDNSVPGEAETVQVELEDLATDRYAETPTVDATTHLRGK